ncbi:MAG: SufD family Fe-S cluster assembly protein, partial [Lachnospiraceae bacterium]|nr:SufD family Fe-S cluster assembly protein [Lachnospiraceae bacterium]
HLDMNYVANHYGKYSKSEIDVAGALKDSAFKILRDTIDFKTGCSGAVGHENDKVFLLGEEVINQSIPLILCAEEDVEGAHGAAIGSLDEEMLFYLASRGIPKEEAEKLVIYANFNKLLRHIPDGDIKDKTEKLLPEVL